jgi:hypothetical protein
MSKFPSPAELAALLEAAAALVPYALSWLLAWPP